MNVGKFIACPPLSASSPSQSTSTAYFSWLSLLISLLTGIILICSTLINHYVIASSHLEVLYLLALLMAVKIVVPINYLCRTKKNTNKSKKSKSKKQIQLQFEEDDEKIGITALFVPGFVKSLFYLGMIMLSLEIAWVYVLIPIGIGVVGLQILDYFINSHNPQEKIQQNQYSSRSRILDIFISLILLGSFLLHIQIFQFPYSISTTIFICISSCFCLLTFFYLHHKIFTLYKAESDQIIAKQYIIQLFNFMLYVGMFWMYGNLIQENTVSTTNTTETLYTTNTTTTNSSTVNSTNTATTTTNTTDFNVSPKFWFVLQYPVHTFIVITFSILYEYLCFQMIKSKKFKHLFFCQLSGIFWFNIFLLTQQNLSTSLYLSAIVSFVALVLLTKLVNFSGIANQVKRMTRWFENKCKKKPNEKMTEEVVE